MFAREKLARAIRQRAIRVVAPRGSSVPGVRTPHRRANATAIDPKRLFDLCVAAALLAVLALPMAVIALLIRLDSRGPALFRQTRAGLGGRPFEIFKFRSMHVAENGAHIIQAQPRDTRVTRIGRILRCTSLDELPQLINVVRGDMALVGPRPHALAHDRHYAALIEDYAQRHRVKPGITGWAQIYGLRGATPDCDAMRARIAFDVWYVNHAGLRLDLEILLRTPREILRRRNAY